MEENIRKIFEKITERYNDPINIGSRCESDVFYRIEDLTGTDLQIVAEYLAQRVENVCSPEFPEYVIDLSNGRSVFSELLARELSTAIAEVQVLPFSAVVGGNGTQKKLYQRKVILTNDVITTARTCLECHAQTTMLNASVLCWAALIDRTFGPGPVPVLAAFTGEPVRIVQNF